MELNVDCLGMNAMIRSFVFMYPGGHVLFSVGSKVDDIKIRNCLSKIIARHFVVVVLFVCLYVCYCCSFVVFVCLCCCCYHIAVH